MTIETTETTGTTETTETTGTAETAETAETTETTEKDDTRLRCCLSRLSRPSRLYCLAPQVRSTLQHRRCALLFSSRQRANYP